MSLAVFCDRCGDELWQTGGILLGPPDENDLAEKLHLCRVCCSIIRGKVLGFLMEDA